MYPKFDSKYHWFQLSGIYSLACYIVLLFLPLVLWLLGMDWGKILLCLCLWLCITLISDYRICRRFPCYTTLCSKEIYPDFIVDLTGDNSRYPLMDDSSVLFFDESFESPVMGDDLLIGRTAKNRVCFLHCYYSDEKKEEIAKLIRKYLKGKKYPLLVTYYKKSIW